MNMIPTSSLVIEYDDMIKLNLKAFKELEQSINKYIEDNKDDSVSDPLSEVALAMKIGDSQEKHKEIIANLIALTDEFRSVFGLSLYISSHVSESTDPDDVDGFFFELNFNEIYHPSVLARKLLESTPFEEKHYIIEDYKK